MGFGIVEVMPYNFANRKWLMVNRESQKNISDKLYAINNKRPGFTLVELLVVLGLLSITITATLLFLTSTLKGSNQTTIIAEVKQNGQVVLDSLERQIRNATKAVEVAGLPEAPNGYIELTFPDASSMRVSCFSSSGNLNGYIGVKKNTDISYTSLTNQDTISGVNVVCNPTECGNKSLDLIEPSSGSLSPPIVSVCFVMQQGLGAPSRADFVASANFQTTISLRKSGT